jgi:serine/threonine-protein kinase HipA
MGRRSHSRSLGLWMNGVFVGAWTISPQFGESLQYDNDWVNSAGGRPLSLSLPFTPGNPPHRGAAVHNYFDNLLPDSKDIRERIARRYKAATADVFGLLSEVGRDCVGALQILPHGMVPAGVQPVAASPLDDTEVARLLRGTLAPAPLGLPDDEDFRISIAGAQEKTALLHFEGRWCMPHGATPTTHILKLPMGLVGGSQYDMRESVENEWLCARILAAYGLPAAPCEVLKFEDMTVLSVERFDRAWWDSPDGDRRLFRLPQEDMCQATGTAPWMKYESDGGPGVTTIMELLAGAVDPALARRTFFQAQVLFWMLCATDGHAKNFSLFLRPGGAYAPTPLYDVLSAYPILGEGPGKLSPFKAKMAMAVRSRNVHWKMRDILRRHWLAVGDRYGIVALEGGGADQLLDDLVKKTPGVIDTVRNQLPDSFPFALADTILSGLGRAADTLCAY